MGRPAKEEENRYDYPLKTYVKRCTHDAIQKICTEREFSQSTVIRKLIEIGIENVVNERGVSNKVAI